MKSKVLLSLLFLLSFTVGGTLAYLFYEEEPPTVDPKPTYDIEQEFPNIVIFNNKGEGNKLYSSRNNKKKHTVLIFFSLSCTNCLSQNYKWAKIFDQYKSKFNFLGIVYDKSGNQFDDFNNRYTTSYKNVLVDDYTVIELGINKWPLVYILDNNHKILYLASGNEAPLLIQNYLKHKSKTL